jgi:hypothetical protein
MANRRWQPSRRTVTPLSRGAGLLRVPERHRDAGVAGGRVRVTAAEGQPVDLVGRRADGGVSEAPRRGGGAGGERLGEEVQVRLERAVGRVRVWSQAVDVVASSGGSGSSNTVRAATATSQRPASTARGREGRLTFPSPRHSC